MKERKIRVGGVFKNIYYEKVLDHVACLYGLHYEGRVFWAYVGSQTSGVSKDIAAYPRDPGWSVKGMAKLGVLVKACLFVFYKIRLGRFF